jgi:hypothetical protein
VKTSVKTANPVATSVNRAMGMYAETMVVDLAPIPDEVLGL